MANQKQVELLKRDVQEWNKWRKKTDETVDLNGADLTNANLSRIDLSGDEVAPGIYGADFQNANFTQCVLRGSDTSGADFRNANLSGADLTGAYMYGVDLSGADLTNANLTETNLNESTLCRTNLTGVNLSRATLVKANLTEANLTCLNLWVDLIVGSDFTEAILRRSNLTEAQLSHSNFSQADFSSSLLIGTNLNNSILSDSRIYGVSAWNVDTWGAVQNDLIISHEDEAVITVDNLEVAQFIYLLLHNEKIRHVIDTITTKTILILGRFTDERKAVLDAMREELRNRNYIPILFDFDKPTNRDLTETVMTLFSLARFIIADLSDPNSIPHELMTLGEKMLSVPIQPLFHSTPEHLHPYPMFEHLLRYQHVLDVYHYENQETLIAALTEKVIDPAESKAKEMRPKKLW